MASEYDTDLAIAAWRTGGDQAAGRWLVAEHYALVNRIVRANLPKMAEEQDLAQEIFLKMFAGLNTFDGRVPFTHWLSRVAVNVCVDAQRARRRRPEMRWSDLTVEEAEVLTATLADQNTLHPAAPLAARELLSKLLETLGAEDRLVLRLLVYEEKSVAEIRELTGWSAALIKVRAFRARLKLRRQLARLEKGPA
jgi:RNA polymerase sigma factor (sigma-70 family)